MVDMANEEVRYHMLRPGQALSRRRACPVAYVPVGTIEWHGPHNPYGTDTLQAEELSILAARLGGGVAMPPLWYGESRVESLMEANAGDRERIAEEMGLPPDNFLPERHPFSASRQTLNYQRLLTHVLAEVESLGFEVGVLVAGHYPLVDHATAAALLFNRRQYSADRRHGMLAWACVDYLLVDDKYDRPGDHAGGWETSHMLATHPELVDLGQLPPKGEKPVGVSGHMPPMDATAAFGSETLRASAEALVKETAHRLANRDLYFRHGCGFRTGLWRASERRPGKLDNP
jgi:creatinine amidohydrolase